MGMNIPSGGASGDPEVLAEINTTPLIDVMLVLLIMLIITIPIQLHSVDLDMPVGQPPPISTPPEVVRIEVDAGGAVSWNGETVADRQALEARLAAAAALPVQPELHVRADKRAAYGYVAGVMAAVQRNGLHKVGLIGAEQFL